MAAKMAKKKAAKITRKGKVKSFHFHFCDLMCKAKNGQKGKAPIPACLKDEKDEFILMCWNFWWCFVSALRKRLPEILTGKEIRSLRNVMLFSLFCENDSYLFLVREEWVAEKMGIPKRYHFSANSPTDAFKKLQYLCFADNKENPTVQNLQKIFAAIKDLPLPDRCQLNLLASAKKPWPKSAINLAKKT